MADPPARLEPKAGSFKPVLLLAPAGVFVLYLLTLSRCHTWDAIAYTARIHDDPLLSERYLSTTLWHPHHLLFGPMGQGFLSLWNVLLPQASNPFLPLQLMVAAMGAATAFLIALLVMHRTNDRWTALLSAGIFAVMHSVWSYSTEVEVMIPALFFVLLAVYVLQTTTRFVGRLVLVTVTVSTSILLHQISVIFCLAVAVYLWSSSGRKHAVTVAAASAATVALVYVAVALLSLAEPSPGAIVDWMLSARSRSVTGTISIVEQLAAGAKGALQTVVSPVGPADLGSRASGVMGMILAATSAGLVLAMITAAAWVGYAVVRKGLARDAFVRFCLVWLVAMAVFVLWFEPDNIEYWIYCGPPALFLAVEVLAERLRTQLRRSVGWILLALLLTVNLYTSIAPRTNGANAAYGPFVGAVRGHMQPGDLILAAPSGSSILVGAEAVAVPFLTGVDLIVVDDSVNERVRTTWTRGNHVYILQEVLRGEPPVTFDTHVLQPVAPLARWQVSRLHPGVGDSR